MLTQHHRVGEGQLSQKGLLKVCAAPFLNYRRHVHILLDVVTVLPPLSKDQIAEWTNDCRRLSRTAGNQNVLISRLIRTLLLSEPDGAG